MAKKIKPISDEFDVIANSANGVECEKTNENVKIFPYSMTEEQAKKLEMYDQIEATNKQLTEEKSELQDKIAEYLIELNQLRSNKKNGSNDSNIEKELAQLKNDYKVLQDASDEYLMKISDLTFENAKLNAQIQELSNSQQSSVSQPITQKPKLEKPIYNSYRQNGYSSWN